MIYLSNAFSIDMLSSKRAFIFVQRVSLGRVKYLLKKGFVSLVKDGNISKVLTKLLETDVPITEERVKLKYGDKLIIVRFSKRISDTDNIDDLKPRFAIIYIR